MYYNRTISKGLASLLETGSELRWLFDFVKNHKELDFLIGKNNSKEWISVYRGLTRILTILPIDSTYVLIDADDKYKEISPNLYGQKNLSENYQNEIEYLITQIEQNSKFDRYYKNKKEGFYQNELSKIFGICGKPDTDFVIIDKEAVIGYSDQAEKDNLFGTLQQKYKQLQREISDLNPERYGKDLGKKAIGNELDFLALDKDGNILLIEYKHGTNTSGIYLSPLQIGLYNDVFTNFPKNELENAVFEMLEQKQKIGLINPNWRKPNIIKSIIPVLIISEFNYKSSAKTKFDDILQFTRKQLGSNFLDNLQTFNFTMKNGLSNW
ncbi:hypothetical protein CHU92_03190 [Flavobacterium cyanobacteriorum]|uniref:Uncharacterized protein n=1 Tax=Flavobacterium cyanobacteriorum TaxID=2022802 RepID=A0A255ZQC3_9FLAO|nr:hypothetical protein [Flavobacterium cyanobacteriorum]OYQ43621.1 hypothetical protein CHU92_03190 [Flavobacterium cyanobacteriorum]